MQRRALVWQAGAVLATALSCGPAARAQATHSLPPELKTELDSARLAGSARLRFFGFDVYDARLWVTPGFRAADYAQHTLGLELNYLRSLSGRAIAERSLQEMRRNQAVDIALEQAWLAAMKESFVDIKAGDRLTGLHQPGVGARFWFNSQPRPSIADAHFSRLFFGIWLAESTSEPRMRADLLAQVKP